MAGAVQPERQEAGWDPRYSVLSLKVGSNQELHTRVYPRRWSKEETTFIPDFNSQGRDYRDHTVDADMAA
jgi:hypothetical protein